MKGGGVATTHGPDLPFRTADRGKEGKDMTRKGERKL